MVVEIRYLYPVPVLLLLLGFFVVENADWGADRACLSELRGGHGSLPASFLPLPAWDLIRLERGREIREKAVTLADVVPVGSRIASDSHWRNTLYLSFYNNYRYYGVSRPKADPSEVNDQLKKFKIDYFFVDTGAGYPLEKGWSEVSHGLVPGLKIFRDCSRAYAPLFQGLRTTFSCVFEGFSRELSSNHIINTNCNALYSPIIYRKVATV